MNTRSYGLKSWFVAGTILLILVAGTLFSFGKAFAIDYFSPIKAFFIGTEVYVNLIEDEITELETELASVEAKLASGEMTTAEAEAARASIVDRMDRINKSVANTNAKGLSPETLAKFRSAVVRLQNVLIDYRDSLVILDGMTETEEATNSTAVKKGPTIHKSHGHSRSLLAIVTETTETVEGLVEMVEEELASEKEVTNEGVVEAEEESSEEVIETEEIETEENSEGDTEDAESEDDEDEVTETEDTEAETESGDTTESEEIEDTAS